MLAQTMSKTKHNPLLHQQKSLQHWPAQETTQNSLPEAEIAVWAMNIEM